MLTVEPSDAPTAAAPLMSVRRRLDPLELESTPSMSKSAKLGLGSTANPLNPAVGSEVFETATSRVFVCVPAPPGMSSSEANHLPLAWSYTMRGSLTAVCQDAPALVQNVPSVL